MVKKKKESCENVIQVTFEYDCFGVAILSCDSSLNTIALGNPQRDTQNTRNTDRKVVFEVGNFCVVLSRGYVFLYCEDHRVFQCDFCTRKCVVFTSVHGDLVELIVFICNFLMSTEMCCCVTQVHHVAFEMLITFFN